MDQIEKQELLASFQNYLRTDKTIKTFNYDPGIIVTIGSKVVSYFSEREADADEEEWVSNITNELTQIKQTLIQIIEILHRLEVTIVEGWRTFVNTALVAAIEGIYQRQEDWFVDDRSHLKEERIQDEIGEYLQALTLAASQARQYGFAHVDTMAISLRIELFLISISEDRIATNTIKVYKEFFQRAIDPSIPDSIGYVLSYHEAQIAANVNKFKTGTYSTECRLDPRNCGGSGGYRMQVFYDVLKVSGDIRDYTWTVNLEQQLLYPHPKNGECFDVRTQFEIKQEVIDHCIGNQTITGVNIVQFAQWFRDAGVATQEHVKQADYLRPAYENCKKYIEILTKYQEQS